MSRIVASIIISIFIVSLCVVERVEVNAIMSDSKNYLSQMTEEYKKDKKQAKETATKFNEFWQDKEKILCLFYADSELDTISVEVATLPILSNNEDEFLHYCSILENRLMLLKEHSARVLG